VGSATTVVHHDIPNIYLRDWVQLPLACVGAALLTYLAVAGLRSAPLPLDLAVRQDGSQLRITWNRQTTARGAILDVIDGGRHTALFVPANLSSVTYLAWTSDVEVRLAAAARDSAVEIARCLVREPESSSKLDREMALTIEGAAALREAFWKRSARVDKLQRTANRLIKTVPVPPERVLAVKSTWWR